MRIASRPALVRLAVIDREIRDGRMPNAATLALQLEVNPRTVHRDLDYLRDQFGAPLKYDRDRNGYFYTNPSYQIPLPQLAEGGAVALFLLNAYCISTREHRLPGILLECSRKSRRLFRIP